ncbi:MAG TPA: rRNA maturation RNase YbeY [Bacteroidales bacterium]
MSVYFFDEYSGFKLKKKRAIKDWIKKVISVYDKQTGNINIVFSSDEEVIEINRQYLNHDYFTDIITFNYNDNDIIHGDIFISIDTVRVNAEMYQVSFENELCRVIIHGVLHLLGFDDNNETLKAMMRDKEDKALEVLKAEFI